VQEHLEHVHEEEHAEDGKHVSEAQDEEVEDSVASREVGSGVTFRLELGEEDVKEDLSELTVSQGESPQTQVRGSVRDATKNELNCLNDLVDEDLSEAAMTFVLGAVLAEHVLNVTEAILKVVVLVDQAVALFVSSGDLAELIGYIVGVVLRSAADKDAWNRAKHDGKADEGEVDKHIGNVLLFWVPEVVGVVLLSQFKESHDVGNDHCDDLRRGRDGSSCLEVGDVLVRVHGVPPLEVDQDDHVTDEAEEDDHTGEDVEDELLVLAEINSVHGVEHDTEVEVEVGNNDGQLLLHTVREVENLRAEVPGRVHAERVRAVLVGSVVLDVSSCSF